MDNEKTSITCNCGCMILALLFNIFVGAWSVNYLLMEFAAKTIPWIAAAAIGMVAGELTVPVAIVVWILKACGVF